MSGWRTSFCRQMSKSQTTSSPNTPKLGASARTISNGISNLSATKSARKSKRRCGYFSKKCEKTDARRSFWREASGKRKFTLTRRFKFAFLSRAVFCGRFKCRNRALNYSARPKFLVLSNDDSGLLSKPNDLCRFGFCAFGEIWVKF